MTALAASEAYRLWAPTYERENVVTTLECALLEQLSPPPRGKSTPCTPRAGSIVT